MDDRELFLNGVLAFSDVFRSLNMDVGAVTVVVSERDGRTMEHILTQKDNMVASALYDDRYSTPKADRTIREFKIAGVTFQYRVKPFMLPNGDVI